MTFSEIKEGDRVRLLRATTRFTLGDVHHPYTYPADIVGTVTTKGFEGLSRHPLIRVRFDGHPGEPLFEFPTSELVFA